MNNGAESLFEAAALGLSLLRQADWGDVIAPGTQLEGAGQGSADNAQRDAGTAPAMV